MLPVTEISRFCMHDGPGVRTTVFLKGCSLSCFWCHNPETSHMISGPIFYESKCIGCRACESVCPAACHSFSEGHRFDRSACIDCGICAGACPADALHPLYTMMSPEQIYQKASLDRAFYGNEGGITLSGGEPLLHPESAELLKLCHDNGLTTCVETCGFVSRDLLEKACHYTDLFLWDVKDSDAERFVRNCGGKLETILDNLKTVDQLGKESILRCIILHGINTEASHYKSLAVLYRKLSHCRRIEILPYHAVYGAKQRSIGLEDTSTAELIPTDEDLSLCEKVFTESAVPFLIRGRLTAGT